MYNFTQLLLLLFWCPWFVDIFIYFMAHLIFIATATWRHSLCKVKIDCPVCVFIVIRHQFVRKTVKSENYNTHNPLNKILQFWWQPAGDSSFLDLNFLHCSTFHHLFFDMSFPHYNNYMYLCDLTIFNIFFFQFTATNSTSHNFMIKTKLWNSSWKPWRNLS